jgi:four helix bundle protein
MDEQEFKKRTKNLAIRTMALVDALPRKRSAEVIGKQLLRSGTSVGANYRAACRGRSTADILSRVAIVEEEADESMYWIELLVEAQLIAAARVQSLLNEFNEIVAMTVASIKTLRSKKHIREKSK